MLCSLDGRKVSDHSTQGDCPLGKFPADPSPLTQLTRGITGLAKAALGVDPADPATVEHRQKTCAACEHVTLTLGVLKRCGKCGCALAAKTRVAGERCPIGKW
jgi:hypothetical protein